MTCCENQYCIKPYQLTCVYRSGDIVHWVTLLDMLGNNKQYTVYEGKTLFQLPYTNSQYSYITFIYFITHILYIIK